jgi:4-hydroxybenzoate polyprenyltransferase
VKPHALPARVSARGDEPRRFDALCAVRLIHPFPTLLNVAATAGLALVAAGGDPPAGVLARMLLLMLCAQSAIGVANDLFDRELDAATKPWKPLVIGAVSSRQAQLLAIALIGATAALAGTLGGWSFVLAVLGLVCGLAYDVRLKRTLLSAVPFMVAIPVLPLWVWVTVGEWQRDLWWLLPLGALLGLALHLANTLPDLEDDAAHGVRGLAHALGARVSALVAWGSYVSAIMLSLAIAPLVGYDWRVYAPAAAFGAGCVVAGAAAFALPRDEFALQAGFGALGIGSAVLAVGWLAALD